jgi:type I restriction enzyme M protein
VNPPKDLVSKLWRLCALLRKDGVTYQQYVTELTYLLFLKMASEQKEESRIPAEYRWDALKSCNEAQVLQTYRQALVDLGDISKVGERSIVAIFQNAATIIREPANLRKLIDAIDGLHWFSSERDAFGDAYEGLLQKMAEETKRGAGQYFTPRALIKVMVELMQPQPGEVIQDPAAGTGGFLIAANSYMKGQTDDYFELSPKQQSFQLREALRGLENVPDTYRLLLMNLHLHAIDPDNLDFADTLSPAGQQARFKNADLILTNPPFGPAGGYPTRDDLTIADRVSSYQLPFVEHCIRALRLGGRAAVIVPDNVLFEEGKGKLLRQRLMSWCNLHTILRLPVGIFYARSAKTNVLFFTRATDEAPPTDATEAVWIYDARSGAPSYGKTNPFKAVDLEDFIRVFGDDPLGSAERTDQGETSRFRKFTREEIAAGGDNLDISWLKDTSAEAEDGLESVEDIAAAIEGHLTLALEEVRGLAEELVEGTGETEIEAEIVEVAE